jgi:thymidylate kinase
LSTTAPLSPATPRRDPAPVTLVARLGEALHESGVGYCQWKGHGKRDRWANGLGDIDLLVERSAWERFARTLGALGFKPAVQPRDPAGVFHFYGLDDWTGQLIHVHAYTRLVLGAPSWAEYHVPLERALLDSASPAAVFRTPAPEVELLVLVLRTLLRYTPLDVMREPPRFFFGALPEIERLAERTSLDALRGVLRQYLPAISPALFDRCREALDPRCGPGRRLVTRLLLARRLSPYLARAPLGAVTRRLARRVLLFPRMRLAGGGAVIALLGGDGSGKSTCARALVEWLQPELATRHLHLGRPRRSVATLACGGLLKAGRALRLPQPFLAHLALLRLLGTARDRYAGYRSAQRFAAHGGIVICERFPTPENWALAGPSEAQGLGREAVSPLADLLRQWERACYERITRPDLTFVLLLDADTAVERKPGEPAPYVRERAALTARADWSGSGALMIDAAQPLPQVLAALKTEIWRSL